MKRLVFLFSCAAALLCAADLGDVHTVYLLKMTKGLDQFLASRLTSERVFQIVTDPKLADAVLTDQIGEGFQAKMDELYPPPESEKPAPKPKTEEDAPPANPMLGDTVNKLAPLSSSFNRSKGSIFLVDSKSHQVVWSMYQPPKGATSKEMDRTATDIVSRLKKDLHPKK